jgi:laminin gamma 1
MSVSGCDCHPEGAMKTQCKMITGKCKCAPLVVGKQCNKCQYGFWNINSGSGCESCQCDPVGSFDNDCDDVTGECRCKPGVSSTSCSDCMAGYWGFSPRGCTSKKSVYT